MSLQIPSLTLSNPLPPVVKQSSIEPPKYQEPQPEPETKASDDQKMVLILHTRDITSDEELLCRKFGTVRHFNPSMVNIPLETVKADYIFVMSAIDIIASKSPRWIRRSSKFVLWSAHGRNIMPYLTASWKTSTSWPNFHTISRSPSKKNLMNYFSLRNWSSRQAIPVYHCFPTWSIFGMNSNEKPEHFWWTRWKN